MHEYRPDHVLGVPRPNQVQPPPSLPQVHYSYVSSPSGRLEGPFDVHFSGDTPHMTETDRRATLVHSHLREPPSGPVDPHPAFGGLQLKWPVGRHLHQSSTIRTARPKPYVSI